MPAFAQSAGGSRDPLLVFVIPGLLIPFVGVHLLMVMKLGINEWPCQDASCAVPRTYRSTAN